MVYIEPEYDWNNWSLSNSEPVLVCYHVNVSGQIGNEYFSETYRFKGTEPEFMMYVAIAELEKSLKKENESE